MVRLTRYLIWWYFLWICLSWVCWDIWVFRLNLRISKEIKREAVSFSVIKSISLVLRIHRTKIHYNFSHVVFLMINQWLESADSWPLQYYWETSTQEISRCAAQSRWVFNFHNICNIWQICGSNDQRLVNRERFR